MRIGLNLLHALPEVGGAWNYIASLLVALADFGSEHTYIGFVTRSSDCLLPAKPNFQKVVVPVQSESRPRRVLFENTALQLLARRLNLDCMHWFGGVQAVFNTVPGLVTVYDLQPLSNPAHFSLKKRAYLRVMMGLTSRNAAMILPISNATRDAMSFHLGADEARMTVIYCPLTDRFKRAADSEIAEFRIRHGLPARFWLYVAHTYPHKNHVRLLTAYHELKTHDRSSWPLVLRGDDKGAKDAVSRTISELGLQNDVILLPRLEASYLPVLYSAASALVFPSLHEGLGIPVLEAMSCGCPTAAAQIPAVQEVGGNALLYFNPLDPSAISEAMRSFQNSEEQRARSRRIGFERAENFRSRQIAQKLLAAYRSVGAHDES